VASTVAAGAGARSVAASFHGVSWVAKAGAVELALGALSGWLVTASVDRPELLRRAGVKAMARVRQAHLDYIIMGVILIALGLAAPGLPRVWQVLLVVGAWVNPTLFVPLAFNPDVQRARPYRAVTLLSFLCMSAGTVAAAVYLLTR
jgi:hypothetical protein